MARMYLLDVTQPLELSFRHSNDINIEHTTFIQLTQGYKYLEILILLVIVAQHHYPITINPQPTSLSHLTSLSHSLMAFRQPKCTIGLPMPIALIQLTT